LGFVAAKPQNVEDLPARHSRDHECQTVSATAKARDGRRNRNKRDSSHIREGRNEFLAEIEQD
jgi:hypothetical protein